MPDLISRMQFLIFDFEFLIVNTTIKHIERHAGPDPASSSLFLDSDFRRND